MARQIRSGSGQRQLEVLRPVQGSAPVSEPDRLGRWFRFVAFWVLLRRLARLAKRHNKRIETKPKPFCFRFPAGRRACSLAGTSQRRTHTREPPRREAARAPEERSGRVPPTALLRAARAATTPLGAPTGHASAARTSESHKGRRAGGIASSGSRRRSSRGPFDCTAAARPARALQ